MSGCPTEVLLVPALSMRPLALVAVGHPGFVVTSSWSCGILWCLAPVKFPGRWAPAEEFAGQAALPEAIAAFPST